MFWPDVLELQQFYDSPMGNTVCQHVCSFASELWQDTHRETIIGLGFCPPFLNDFLPDNIVTAIMPFSQGVYHWPSLRNNLSMLADEAALPFMDNSIDKVMLIHILEYSDQTIEMLKEVWRILVPGGKILAVVPNRLGLWAHNERTPFGHGHPFTFLQLNKLLNASFFTPTYHTSRLFAFPSIPSLFPELEIWENIGKRWLQPFGGLLCVEAEKKIYAVPPAPEKVKNRIRISMPKVSTSPQPV